MYRGGGKLGRKSEDGRSEEHLVGSHVITFQHSIAGRRSAMPDYIRLAGGESLEEMSHGCLMEGARVIRVENVDVMLFDGEVEVT